MAPPRHVHPFTPLVQAAKVVPGVFLAMLVFAGLPLSPLGRLAVALGAAVTVSGLVAIVQWLSWRRLTYWFDADGDLRVDSGILQRNERRLQLSRLQSVDVQRPFVARLVGMAQVHIDVAGETNVTLEYLQDADAEALRHDVLSRAGRAQEQAAEGQRGAARPPVDTVDEERVLARVAPGDLALSLLLRTSTVVLIGATGLFLAITFATRGAAGLGLAVITGGVPAFAVATRFTRYYGFTVAEAPDGLRLRHGLFSTTASTVPAGRVQAIGFEESWLWRRLGWVEVQLNVAGTQGSGQQQSESILLPVATWADAWSVVNRVLPGVDLTSIPLVPAPRRARWRAPLQWRWLAFGHDERVAMVRRGLVVRHHAVVPHPRTQSVRVTQGPWERSLRLASVHIDSTPGPVRIAGLHLDAARARSFAEGQADRARLARTSGSHG